MAKLHKIGIIGLGGMGRRHCEAARQVANADLVAVCDIVEANIDKAKKTYGVKNGYTRWADLLKNETLDLLVVATNGPTHAQITIAAAQEGVPRILCEKPMTTSLGQARDMIEACAKNNVRLAVNHLRRWVPAYARLKELLARGTIGEIRHITFEMAGGQMASNGGHFWDLVRFLTGREPVRVQGFLDKTGTVNPRGAQFKDPGAYGLLWLEGGTRVFFDMAEDYGVPFFMEIMGSVGRVIVDEKANRWEVSARSQADRDQPMTKRPSLVNIPFEGEPVDMIKGCKSILEELLGDGPITCTGEDGMKSLAVTIGVHESEDAGHAIIELPLLGNCYHKEFQFT